MHCPVRFLYSIRRLAFCLALSALLPLFQQFDNGLLHLLRRVGAREVFAQPVAGDGDAVYLRLLLLGHDRPHDSGSQLSALGELLELGIEVLFCDDFGPLKGMYRVIKRNRFIFINKDLSERMQRIVCAHELGHDQLHRHFAKGNMLQEFMLYDMATKPEYEANIVAAEILLDTDELLEYIYQYGYTSEQIARVMNTDINLVALKIAHLAETGYDLRRIEHRSDFLK